MDLKKAGCKKQGHCYSKREKAARPLLFLNKVQRADLTCDVIRKVAPFVLSKL